MEANGEKPQTKREKETARGCTRVLHVCKGAHARVCLCAASPLHTLWIIVATSCQDSPNDYDDKIQQVPAVSDVRVLVHDQTVGNDLQKCLYRENDQEGIFHCFLRVGGERKKSRTHVGKGEKEDGTMSS